MVSKAATRKNRTGGTMGIAPQRQSANPDGSAHKRTETSFAIKLSLRFIFVSFLCVAMVSFSVGRYAVERLIQRFHMPTTTTSGVALPPPAYPIGKEVPHTVYTSKNYDTGVEGTSDSLLARRGVDFVTTDVDYDVEAKADELHEPAGQHLLIDIKSVDGAFLNSVHRLAAAMVELVSLSGLTMLSYHCHDLIPVGVSCAGVLLESHISFHTWPIEGVITLDLFTCGPQSLLPHMPTIQKLFAVPRTAAVPGAEVEEPHIQWSYKKRGFHLNAGATNPEEIDMQQFLLGWFEYDMKEVVVSEETDFQRVEIFDVISTRMRDLQSYKLSLKDDQSYEAQNPELFRPDRILYLDGIMQSRLHGESAYHEALVHPAMVSHNNPKRVAIIGGGEGATLREALKYETVESVVMVEIDGLLVNIAREHLTEWNSCDFLENGTKSCFDDPRAEVYFEDAIAWFIDRYLDENSKHPKFDVIIMDALDPSSVVEFSDILYKNSDLTISLSNALGEDGIFVAQTGEAPVADEPPAMFRPKSAHVEFMENLAKAGVGTFTKYEEGECGFMGPWSFMVGFKDSNSFSTWLQTQADVDTKLHRRAKRTVKGELPFRSFDGATMMAYQYPSRLEEEVHCKNGHAECAQGHGFHPERSNAQLSSFEVRKTAENGQGFFAKEDLSAGSYIAANEAVHSVFIRPTAVQLIERFSKSSLSTHRWAVFNEYLKDFSVGNSTIDAGSIGLIRHVNNGKNETRSAATDISYSPFQQRNSLISANVDVMLNDVKAGQEITWDPINDIGSSMSLEL